MADKDQNQNQNLSNKINSKENEQTPSQAPFNYLTLQNNAYIANCSSFVDQCEPNNILSNDRKQLWISQPDLPQTITIDLSHLAQRASEYKCISFDLWHDYDSNPRVIELFAKEKGISELTHIGTFNLECMEGVQCFNLNRPLNGGDTLETLNLSITQTYGANKTYINQIMLYDQMIQVEELEEEEDNFNNLNLEDGNSNFPQQNQNNLEFNNNNNNRQPLSSSQRQSQTEPSEMANEFENIAQPYIQFSAAKENGNFNLPFGKKQFMTEQKQQHQQLVNVKPPLMLKHPFPQMQLPMQTFQGQPNTNTNITQIQTSTQTQQNQLQNQLQLQQEDELRSQKELISQLYGAIEGLLAKQDDLETAYKIVQSRLDCLEETMDERINKKVLEMCENYLRPSSLQHIMQSLMDGLEKQLIQNIEGAVSMGVKQMYSESNKARENSLQMANAAQEEFQALSLDFIKERVHQINDDLQSRIQCMQITMQDNNQQQNERIQQFQHQIVQQMMNQMMQNQEEQSQNYNEIQHQNVAMLPTLSRRQHNNDKENQGKSKSTNNNIFREPSSDNQKLQGLKPNVLLQKLQEKIAQREKKMQLLNSFRKNQPDEPSQKSQSITIESYNNKHS